MTLLAPPMIAFFRTRFHVMHPTHFFIEAYFGLPKAVLGALVFSLVMLVAWIFVVKRDWVRQAGDQYARALLANCDSLKDK